MSVALAIKRRELQSGNNPRTLRSKASRPAGRRFLCLLCCQVDLQSVFSTRQKCCAKPFRGFPLFFFFFLAVYRLGFIISSGQDIIILPEEAVYRKVDTGREGERVFLMEIAGNRRFFYWMQDKDPEKDEASILCCMIGS